MAFVDEMHIYLQAGDGGDGVERWRHEKYKEYAGPSGGNGGRGGNVYVVGVHNINALKHYLGLARLSASDGAAGGSDSKQGASGAPLVLEVPRGSVLTNRDTGEVFRIEEVGEEVLLLQGGAGGLGNEHFKSSRNTRPTETTPGEKGEGADFDIEVELFADFGLVGLPSVGKSSLLNELTSAQSKTGDYAFTTLEPHLGVMYSYVIADIPGLIRGASYGKGLGHTFLRHIRRTRMLIHCVSCTSDDVEDAYFAIRTELHKYDPELSKKPEIVVLTKRDEVSDGDYAALHAKIARHAAHVYSTSILDDASIKQLRESLIHVMKK